MILMSTVSRLVAVVEGLFNYQANTARRNDVSSSKLDYLRIH